MDGDDCWLDMRRPSALFRAPDPSWSRDKKGAAGGFEVRGPEVGPGADRMRGDELSPRGREKDCSDCILSLPAASSGLTCLTLLLGCETFDGWLTEGPLIKSP